MKTVATLEALDLHGVVLCIGNFDGVHLGHRRLLQRMRERADESGLASVVLTFFPPARVLFGKAQYLTSPDEKLALLARYNPTATVLTAFDHAYAKTDSVTFLASIASLEPDTVIVGENFRFGHGRAGTIADLAAITDKLEVFNLQHYDGGVVSSSRIRDHLRQGRVEEAARLLGGPYRVRGRVIEGDRRGRTIGYPTANVEVPAGKALPSGVFAVEVCSGAGRHGGMANVGPRPSFPAAPPALEVHLFEYAGDLYGQEIDVDFVGFLRHQLAFDGLESLRRQLAADESAARESLAGKGAEALC